jgi:hypothetical protein
MVIRSYVTFVRIPNLHGRLISLGGHVESGHRLSIVYEYTP